MTSPSSSARSVVVRLAMDTSSYVSGASRAEASTLTLDKAVQRVGPNAATSMERAAAGAGKAETAMGRLNKTVGVLGVSMGGLVGVGAAVAGAMSVKWAGDYQSALTRLVTTAGESPGKIKQVGQAFLDMAGQVGITADEIAKGAYTAESAGFHGAAAVTVMKAATEGARQENADLGKVVNAVTTILHDYHLSADDAAKVTSQLVTAVSHGKVSFDELTGALDAITPLASRAGISIADVTGTLAAMTASGMSADQATQNMQNTLLHLANPTNTMIAELAQLGVSTDDLATSLSTKGLAGTLQMVEEAIVNQLDPATQRVLLPALNKSKTAAQDLQVMLGQMPPSVAKLSRGLMDGSVSLTDYRKQVRGLGGQAEVMGTQFMNLFQSSQGFNNVLKAGGPNAQVFTSAMSKAFGTTSALNVALQTTGENASATNKAIKDIAGATAQADGNIKGWSEVQGNFNQQLAQFEAHAKSLAIEAGQHLLPMLTTTFGYVNRDVLPALEHLGSWAVDAEQAWSRLPAPIKDVSLALAGMALANKIGLLSAMTTRVGMLTSGVGRLSAAFSEELAMQRWAVTVGGITGATAGAEVGISRMAVAGGLATRAMSGLGSGASKLMGVFGGPWGVALAAGAVATYGLVKWLTETNTVIPKVTVSTQSLTQAIEANSGAIDENVRKQAAQALQQAGLFKAAQQWGISTETLTDAALGQKDAIQQVSLAAEAYKQKMDATAQSTAVQADQSGIAADAYEKAAMQSDSWLQSLEKTTGIVAGTIDQQRQLAQAVYGTADTVDGLKNALTQMGLTSETTWNNNVATINGATAAEIQDLKNLGLTVKTLPNGDISVSADTQSARNSLSQLTNDYAQYSINLGVKVGSGHFAAADGGILPGFTPGRDVHTFTSPSGGSLSLSGGEAVMRPEFTKAVGPGWIHSMNAAARAGGAAGVRSALGFAGGGVLPMYLTAKVGIKPGDVAAAESSIPSIVGQAMAALAGVPVASSANIALGQALAAARGWTGADWLDLLALWNRESGWRNTAQNPTSTAYGIPQLLNGTWASTGYAKSSDPRIQILAGMDYIAGRYHNPVEAWSHEIAYGWYDQGGPLQPGLTLALNGTGKPETVRTAEQEQTVQRQLRTREMTGVGGSSGIDVKMLAAALRAVRPSLIETVNQNFYGDNNEYKAIQELNHSLQVADLGGRYGT